MNILDDIRLAKQNGKKLLAILIDPDKITNVHALIDQLKQSPPDYLFVGGSKVDKDIFDRVIEALHSSNICPIIIFPGGYQQVNDHSDAILLLSLISGRNAEYLIGQHVKAAKTLDQYTGEVIPTSYILIDGQNKTSVQEVSQTTPISQENFELISDTVVAGKLLGHQLHYLEAGSGAKENVSVQIINNIRSKTPHPLIVGGGIRNAETAKELWDAGADIIVVGNGFEDRSSLLSELKLAQH